VAELHAKCSNGRFTVKSDSKFPYSGPVIFQFKISFSLICVHTLMTNKHI